ncbi:hypothetical protein [Oceanicella actignis]|uniref:Uncharacterized protein n=1 Tax=Oceanicella actignis TaxID=1189325 RepID=A0A1M7U224_9RHOB|nr:hypothetical protein [Oceanicella actignis]SES76551.1 hypothetical protein SAMN04488119_101395 [Oceanicella actignis]SHN76963.1 hypothetical protein SAMN05216200_11427 [Oceanicella actignis]
MSDLFKPCEGVPLALFAGAFWTWRADALGLDPDAHGLAFVLTPEGGGAAIRAEATPDAAGFLVEVPGSRTAAATPGRWAWSAVIMRLADGEIAHGPRGFVQVMPAPADGDAPDARSRNRRILDAITARIEGRITKDAESYTIEGRSIARTPLEVLDKLRTRYARLVAAEDGRGGVRWKRMTLR